MLTTMRVRAFFCCSCNHVSAKTPDPSASEVTTLWRYTNLFIIIIIMLLGTVRAIVVVLNFTDFLKYVKIDEFY